MCGTNRPILNRNRNSKALTKCMAKQKCTRPFALSMWLYTITASASRAALFLVRWSLCQRHDNCLTIFSVYSRRVATNACSEYFIVKFYCYTTTAVIHAHIVCSIQWRKKRLACTHIECMWCAWYKHLSVDFAKSTKNKTTNDICYMSTW